MIWTPKAFHVREIPANNIIHVTESLAVRQTRQNTSFFFNILPSQTLSQTSFLDREKSNQSTRDQSIYMQVCVHILEYF